MHLPVQMEKMKKNVNSDFYFNNPDKVKDMEEYCDVTVVDAMGAFVPEDKSEGNLKKVEANIRSRFNLGGEDY